MLCSYCENEMTGKGHACKEGIKVSAILGTGNCHDYNAPPGSCHHLGCDVERCPQCGGQSISCDCTVADYWASRDKVRWTGEWPGKRECRHHGFFCHDLVNGRPVETTHDVLIARKAGGKVKWHVPCGKDDIGAHEDLNRWTDLGRPGIPPKKLAG